jgi:uncharacterized Zn-binding protein involved in type VI secretion
MAGPLTIAEGSSIVYIGGKKAARTGDLYGGVHVAFNDPHPTHIFSCGPGSNKVFIGGKQAFRITDSTSCTSTQVGGSTKVFFGG